jgi:hypothetical protein
MFTSPLNIRDEALASVDHSPAPAPAARPMSEFKPKGRFQVEHWNKDGELLGTYDVPNGITDEGMNHILETEFHGGTPITTWYIGLVDNASFSAFANADVMNSHAGWIEYTGYSNSTRVAWTPGSAASRSITNASTDDFNINVNSQTIKGIFITEGSAKGGTTGKLWSTAAFGSTVPVNSGDVLKITYTVSG